MSYCDRGINFFVHLSDLELQPIPISIPLRSVLQDAPNGPYPVLPIDFFTFGVGSAMVGDGDFVDADSFSSQFGSDLRLESEAVLFNAY